MTAQLGAKVAVHVAAGVGVHKGRMWGKYTFSVLQNAILPNIHICSSIHEETGCELSPPSAVPPGGDTGCCGWGSDQLILLTQFL